MNNWPDRRFLDLFGLEVPIIQAPMAGPGTPELAIAVSDAGGLGSTSERFNIMQSGFGIGTPAG
jgi:NAD(P)H-dependent flavin oxidoreductase YrpB (nitropropane dioxygenase family)